LPKGPQLGGASTGFGVQQVVHLDGGTSATEAFLPTDAADAEVWAALAAALGKVGPIA
jgi:glucokinase